MQAGSRAADNGRPAPWRRPGDPPQLYANADKIRRELGWAPLVLMALDSVFIAAVVIAVVVMMVLSGAINRFVHRHPTIKMLALAFLILVGTALVADAAHFHIPRAYLYFAINSSAFCSSTGAAAVARATRHPNEVPHSSARGDPSASSPRRISSARKPRPPRARKSPASIPNSISTR